MQEKVAVGLIGQHFIYGIVIFLSATLTSCHFNLESFFAAHSEMAQQQQHGNDERRPLLDREPIEDLEDAIEGKKVNYKV